MHCTHIQPFQFQFQNSPRYFSQSGELNRRRMQCTTRAELVKSATPSATATATGALYTLPLLPSANRSIYTLQATRDSTERKTQREWEGEYKKRKGKSKRQQPYTTTTAPTLFFSSSLVCYAYTEGHTELAAHSRGARDRGGFLPDHSNSG